MSMHVIDYQIVGDDLQFVEIELDPGEAAVGEAGAMMYMEDGISMDTLFGDGSEQQSGLMGKLFGAVQQKGYACVCLKLYWKKHLIKCEIALAKGKKEFDKRDVERERDSNREIQRAVRHEQR